MWSRSCVVLLAAFVSFECIADGPRVTFKGVEFGSSVDTFRDAFPGAECRKHSVIAPGASDELFLAYQRFFEGKGPNPSTFNLQKPKTVETNTSICSGGPIPYLGELGSYTAVFTNNRLSAVDVSVVGVDPRRLGVKLRDSIVEVFGSPTEIEANVRSEGRLAAWTFPDEKSIAISFCATLCQLLFFERGAQVSLRDARLDSQRNPAKDF